MRAAQLRDLLIRYILERDSDAIIATEVALPATLHFPHAAVADVYVLSSDSITIWEIKGEGDTYRRLPAQLPVYRNHAQRVNVLVSPALEARLRKHVPDDVGLYSVEDGAIAQRRGAAERSPDLASVASLLEKPRLMLFAKAFGLAKAPRPNAGAAADVDERQISLGIDLPQRDEAPPAPSILYRREPYKHELEEIVATRIVDAHGAAVVLNALRDELRKWFTNDEQFRRTHVQHANRTSPTLLAGEIQPYDNGYCRYTIWFDDYDMASKLYWSFYHAKDGVFVDALDSRSARGERHTSKWCVRMRGPVADEQRIAEIAREHGALPIGLLAKAS